MAVIEEPVGPAMLVRLRQLVWDHKRAERRQHYAAVLHLSAPGQRDLGLIEEPLAGTSRKARPGTLRRGRRTTGDPSAHRLDLALRTDALGAAIRRAQASPDGPALMTWLTRPGEPDVQDLDLEWLRAIRSVSAETGADLTFVVVTRHGWLDPASGVQRRWQRLRIR